jgi:Spy/CpxP family protein refolding chaperone
MLALPLASLATAAVLLATPVRVAAQVPADDPLACLLPVLGDLQGPASDPGKAERIDPKAGADANKPKTAHKWWRVPEMRAQFGITDAQSAELDGIYHSFYGALKSGTTEVERYQRDVSQIMADTASTEPDVLHAIDKLETAKARLSRTRTLMLYRMYRVLTPEQRVKVKKFQDHKDAAATAPR